ncbi:MAG: helix-turn-helix transcriptional regulator, partial [Verrucomicrobiae bacterium]|nr:helix-turn-helix transcriptional regulator [Verrucomicrobiae bacterium]
MTKQTTRVAADGVLPARRRGGGRVIVEPGAAHPAESGSHLFGQLDREGFRITWYEFAAKAAVDLSHQLVPGTVEVCLNLDGAGRMEANGEQAGYARLSTGFYHVGDTNITVVREAGGRHCFVIVAFACEHLERELTGQLAATHPLIHNVLQDNSAASRLGPVQPLTPGQRQLALGLRSPAVTAAALGLWYRCKAHELMAQFFFRTAPGENFCTRQNRLAEERVRRVIAVLRQDLSSPPSLKELGRKVGCSPFHLSRTFSRQTGLTIPQYLRHLRMHRAAELLRTGRANVTEAALEVGYNSLSHFSVAFHETFGCCPGLYPWGAKKMP